MQVYILLLKADVKFIFRVCYLLFVLFVVCYFHDIVHDKQYMINSSIIIKTTNSKWQRRRCRRMYSTFGQANGGIALYHLRYNAILEVECEHEHL